MESSNYQQPKQKLYKEQRNLSRKKDLKQATETDKRLEKIRKQLEEDDEEGRESSSPQHVIEVEINIIENMDDQKTPRSVSTKRKSTTPQRARRKPRTDPTADGDADPETVPSSPSQASFMSESAAEELCHLRNYYSKQLRRINYVSHEYLGQPAESGVLACIRGPLRSLRLPGRVTIAETARSLWTRVSGRRKLIHRGWR